MFLANFCCYSKLTDGFPNKKGNEIVQLRALPGGGVKGRGLRVILSLPLVRLKRVLANGIEITH